MDEQLLNREVVFKKPQFFANVPPILGNSNSETKNFTRLYKQYLSQNYTQDAALTCTALNSSPKSDGAVCMLVASDKGKKKISNRDPLLKARSWSRKGVLPEVMGLGMAKSPEEAAKRADMKLEEIDQFEIHEAFASTALATYKSITQKTGFTMDQYLGTRLNPNGGTLAIGHGIGATGLRLVHSCQQALQENPDAKSVATAMCAGGGVEASMIFERV